MEWDKPLSLQKAYLQPVSANNKNKKTVTVRDLKPARLRLATRNGATPVGPNIIIIHHQKAFRNKSHTSHGQDRDYKDRKGKKHLLTIN